MQETQEQRTEEPGELQSMESQRVRRDWVTVLNIALLCKKEAASFSPLLFSSLIITLSLYLEYYYRLMESLILFNALLSIIIIILSDTGTCPKFGQCQSLQTSSHILFTSFHQSFRASLLAQMIKNLPAIQETWIQSLGRDLFLEKKMEIHSSILAWRIPWTEKRGGPQFMGSQIVRHDWVAKHDQAFN